MKAITKILEEYMELPEFSGIDLRSANQKGHFGDSPLHVAVFRKDVEEVNGLLAAGADPNCVGEFGYTPLHNAVSLDQPAIVERLLKAGARQDIANADGVKPRQLAKSSKVSELLEAASATNP
jgi:uncharacterized protein